MFVVKETQEDAQNCDISWDITISFRRVQGGGFEETLQAGVNFIKLLKAQNRFRGIFVFFCFFTSRSSMPYIPQWSKQYNVNHI